jgi:hypothetical protein
MPSDPIECRENALRCTQLSERSTDPQLKEILKGLAENWLRRATELERAYALRTEPKAK